MTHSIFICDDDISYLNKIKTIIEHYILFHEEQFHIEKITTSTIEFLKYIEDIKISGGVYFLDMDFKQDINGIDLALKIKQRDIQAKIIFITN
ncbi:DNA-binding response regulator, partial [Staphylococcus aureus]